MKASIALAALALTACGSAMDEIKKEAAAQNAAQAKTSVTPAPGAPQAQATPTSEVMVATDVKQFGSEPVTVSTTITMGTTEHPLAKEFVGCAAGPHGHVMAYVVVERKDFDSTWLINYAYRLMSDAEKKAQEQLNEGKLASDLGLGEQFSDGCVSEIGG